MEPNNNINLINPTPTPTVNPGFIPQSAPVSPVPIVPPTPPAPVPPLSPVPTPIPTPAIPPSFIPPTTPPPMAPVTPSTDNDSGYPVLLTILGLLILVLVAGGFYWWYTKSSMPAVTIETPTASTTAQVTYLNYVNTAFGYQFQYPSDHAPFSAINVSAQTLIPSTSTSTSVNILDVDQSMSITATSSKVTIPAGISATSTMFAGMPATLVMGSSTPDTFYKTILVKLSSATSTKQWTLVIVENGQSPIFEQILSTFTLLADHVFN